MAKLLKLPAVLDRIPYCRTKLYELIDQGAFPRPVKIGRCNAWLEEEVETHIAALVAERDAELSQAPSGGSAS